MYDKIKAVCEKYGYTVTGATKLAGLSSSLPSNWKKGRLPRIDQLEKLATVLNCDLDEFMKTEDPIEVDIDSLSEDELDIIKYFRRLSRRFRSKGMSKHSN